MVCKMHPTVGLQFNPLASLRVQAHLQPHPVSTRTRPRPRPVFFSVQSHWYSFPMGSPRGTGSPAHLTAKREEVPLSDPLHGDSFDARARVSSAPITSPFPRASGGAPLGVRSLSPSNQRFP